MFKTLNYNLGRIVENDPAARSKLEVLLLCPMYSCRDCS